MDARWGGQLVEHDGIVPGLQGLCDLIDAGYRSAGINYGCGCTGTKWSKDHKIVDEYYTLCDKPDCHIAKRIREWCAIPINNSRIMEI